MSKTEILLACADRDSGQSIKEMLERSGFLVRMVLSGGSVLPSLRLHRSDLLLMDWELPDLSCMAVTWQFRLHT